MTTHNNYSKIKLQKTVVAQLETPQLNSNNNLDSLFIPMVVSLGIFGTVLLIWFLNSFLCVCKPNEVVILSGRKRKTASGQEVGYRVLTGGRGIRIPILETVKRIDVTTMPVTVKVTNAYAKGGTPLDIQAIANVKISSDPQVVGNAIERFLDQDRQEISRVARETLEGNLRGVVATLTPEQVNEDKIAFAKSLLDEAEEDLEKLGLVLDNLQIQNISDEVHYLNSIGRQQQAELLRDARIAEATAKAESNIKDSANKKSTSLRQIGRDLEIAKAEAEKRIRDAVTKRSALVAEAEAEAEVIAKIAKAEAELAVQNERIKQVKQQLQADIVAPAEAQCKQAIAKAKGDAASIIEDGKAQAEGTQRLAESWKAAGADAKDIFLFQKLETLMKMMAAGVPNVKVESLTVIDGKDGGKATQIASFVEQLRQTTGVDVAQLAQNLTGNEAVKSAKSVKKLQPSEIES